MEVVLVRPGGVTETLGDDALQATDHVVAEEEAAKAAGAAAAGEMKD